MSWTNLSMTAAMATAMLVLLPVGSAAPAVITGGVSSCVGPTPPPPLTHPDNGSCNLVFRDERDLAGLSTKQLVETVNESCPGFPNGPYLRSDSLIDYVTLLVTTPPMPDIQGLSAGMINGQIGTDLDAAVTVSVKVTGNFTNNGAMITIEDQSPVDSQILDLGGFDFVLFEKSQGGGGGQKATLVCEINMWYDDGLRFGLQDFAVNHGVNQITVGWVAGPSGHFSQDNAEDACDLANLGESDAEVPEQDVSYLVGTYKSTTEFPVSIINVTGCGLDGGGDPVLTAYCDGGEVAGSDSVFRPNACNPEGETGGLPDVTSSGVTGSASTCFFVFRGTPMSFPC